MDRARWDPGRGGRGGWWRVLVVEVLAVPVLLVPVLLVPALLGARPAAADTGPWAWPLAGPPSLGRDFAPPAGRYGSGHRGIDLVGEPGVAVRAAGAGRVSYAGLLAGRGVVVVVHGGLRTTYEPVTAVVPVGAVVDGGEQIGVLQAGHGGCPSTACLHWGLRRGEAYLDPVGLAERRPARLLPLEADSGTGPLSPASAAVVRPQAAVAGAPAPGADLSPVGPPIGVRPGAGRPANTPWDALPTALPPASAPQGAEASPVPQEPVRRTGGSRADVWLGLLAAAALFAGIGVLAGRRPEPDGPAAAALPGPVRPEDVDETAQAPVLELATERLRRRATS